MGKVFLTQWNAAKTEAKLECARLLDMQVEAVEWIMAMRTKALVEAGDKKK